MLSEKFINKAEVLDFANKTSVKYCKSKSYPIIMVRYANVPSDDSEVNPIGSYVTKADVIIPGDPRYRGYYITATGFMISQCKIIFKKKTIRVYSYSPEGLRKLSKAAFAFKSEKERDEMLNKLLTKLDKKYIIKYRNGYWIFAKNEDEVE